MNNEKNIKKRLIELARENVPNLYSITGGMGLEFGKNKKFHNGAKKAAQKKTTVVENNIYWVPLKVGKKILVVCGIKSHKKPETEIKLLEGLASELKYEEFLKEQVNKQVDVKSDFVKTILETNEIKNFDQAIDKGDIIGVNLRSPQAVVIIKTPGFSRRLVEKNKKLSKEELSIKMSTEYGNVAKKISAAFKNYDQNIIAHFEIDMFVVLKWAKGSVNTLNTIEFFKEKAQYINEIAAKATGTEATAGVGQYYPGLSGLKKSYHDAKIALEIGSKIWGEGRSYHITDIGMFISLSPKVSFERKCELASQLLGDILTDKDLNKTVNIFLECDMNLTDAARKLHLHRNTLIYRLNKIKKDIGLDPRNFTDAVQIKLGLMLFNPNKKCREG